MQLAQKFAKSILLFGLIAGLIACGGDGDGDTRFTPTLPADAARITSANAADIVDAVFGSIDGLGLATGFKNAEAPPSLQEILKLVTARVQPRGQRSVSVAHRTETQECDISSPQGSITVNVNETSSTASGSAVFTNCVISGLTIDGRFTFNSTFDNVSGEYGDDFNGSLSFDFGTESFSMVFDFGESGNFLSGSYSRNVNFSVSGLPGGGFLVTTNLALTGNGLDITSGQVIVRGAGNTRLRISITATNTADVDLDEGSGYFDFATCTNLTTNLTCI
ncbi:MAG: hypothetical protein OEO19_04420 [Gammaproteobacteria bacterium]|nr:hypothetical protein [Gammaproteobacteria bacterium]MDH3449671.1 hypothetical protein [Gammaproteobacteria bacterium]